jgi:hypothetical protein
MKCNATLTDSYKGVIYQCELDSTHYDVDIPPDLDAPPAERDPGGWHKCGIEVWADHAQKAQPHVDEQTASATDPLPQYSAEVSFNDDGNRVWGMTVHGPAAFVAHVVNTAADAFEEDAQR